MRSSVDPIISERTITGENYRKNKLSLRILSYGHIANGKPCKEIYAISIRAASLWHFETLFSPLQLTMITALL